MDIRTPPSLISFPSPSHSGDRPTLLHLVNMKRVDGQPLNVIGQIAVHYYTFGMNLLQDDNGVEIDVIEGDHIQRGNEAIARAILKRWLRDGGPTLTYPHLIDCLRKTGLGALADEISAQLQLKKKKAHESVRHCRSCS